MEVFGNNLKDIDIAYIISNRNNYLNVPAVRFLLHCTKNSSRMSGYVFIISNDPRHDIPSLNWSISALLSNKTHCVASDWIIDSFSCICRKQTGLVNPLLNNSESCLQQTLCNSSTLLHDDTYIIVHKQNNNVLRRVWLRMQWPTSSIIAQMLGSGTSSGCTSILRKFTPHKNLNTEGDRTLKPDPPWTKLIEASWPIIKNKFFCNTQKHITIVFFKIIFFYTNVWIEYMLSKIAKTFQSFCQLLYNVQWL